VECEVVQTNPWLRSQHNALYILGQHKPALSFLFFAYYWLGLATCLNHLGLALQVIWNPLRHADMSGMSIFCPLEPERAMCGCSVVFVVAMVCLRGWCEVPVPSHASSTLLGG
jgi:hypothetical protein